MGRKAKGAACTAALILAAALCGCGGPDDRSEMPMQDIKIVMEAHVDELMAIEGVTAVAIGELEDGTPCIQVYVVEKNEEVVRRIPKALEGHPVIVEESGIIEPM